MVATGARDQCGRGPRRRARSLAAGTNRDLDHGGEPARRRSSCEPAGSQASKPSITKAICGSSFTRVLQNWPRRGPQRAQPLRGVGADAPRAVFDVSPDAHCGHCVPVRPIADRTSCGSLDHRPIPRPPPHPGRRSEPPHNRIPASIPHAQTRHRGRAPWPTRRPAASWWKSSTWSCGPANRLGQFGKGVAVRQDRLADGGAVCGLTATDPGRDRPVTDLLEVDDVGSVQDGEVHGKPGDAVQFTQQRGGAPHQPVLMHGQRAQLHQPHAQLVVPSAAAQPAQLYQPLQHSVRR